MEIHSCNISGVFPEGEIECTKHVGGASCHAAVWHGISMGEVSEPCFAATDIDIVSREGRGSGSVVMICP